MIDWLTVAIEICILGFFALLYYLYQGRKVKRHFHNERVEAYALWIYDYHHYLEEIKDSPHYNELNAFVAEIETVDLENQMQRQTLNSKIPKSMDDELKERLCKILED